MLRWNLIANNVPLLEHHRCGVRALNLAASRDGRNITMLLGYRAMNAVVEGGTRPPEAGRIRRYEVGSTTLEGLLDRHVSLPAVHASEDTPAISVVEDSTAPIVQLLKLDCEGCESEVVAELQERPALVSRIVAITGELHGCYLHSSATSRAHCAQMKAFFQSHWNKTRSSLGTV